MGRTLVVETGQLLGLAEKCRLETLLEKVDGLLFHLLLGHHQAQPPFHHVEHLAIGIGKVFQILGGRGQRFEP